MDPVVDPKRRQAIKSIVVLPTISKQISHHRNLNDQCHKLLAKKKENTKRSLNCFLQNQMIMPKIF